MFWPLFTMKRGNFFKPKETKGREVTRKVWKSSEEPRITRIGGTEPALSEVEWAASPPQDGFAVANLFNSAASRKLRQRFLLVKSSKAIVANSDFSASEKQSAATLVTRHG
jgi:hypothetical protein